MYKSHEINVLNIFKHSIYRSFSVRFFESFNSMIYSVSSTRRNDRLITCEEVQETQIKA